MRRAAAAILALLLVGAAAGAAEPVIQGVYSLELGQTRAEAERALSSDGHFRRVAARFHEGFPLYQVTLGSRELGVRPAFRDGRLVKIELRFRETASPNDVAPVIRDQVRFAAGALSDRFGEPDQVLTAPGRIVPGSFEDGGRTVTHRWERGDRVAEIVLWRDRFEHGAAIVLAEKGTRAAGEDPSGAF